MSDRPTHNLWRIPGAMGINPNPTDPRNQEVLTQGIGFPLRPIDNVPSPESPDFSTFVAQGSGVQFFRQGWEEGKLYPEGSMLTNGIFTMIANKLTLDNPYPVPDGTPTFTLPTYVPLTESDLSVIYSGHTWTFTENVLIKALRIWVTEVTADTNYRVVIIRTFLDSDPVTTVIEEQILTTGDWTTIALLNELVVAGTTLLIYIDALNSGSSNEVTGGWNYTGQDNIAPPAQAAWNQNNARTVVRINKTDLDATDRTAELLGISVNSTLQFADTSNVNAFDLYRTTGPPVDSGTFITYPVVLQNQGEGGVPIGTTTLTATIPISQVTEYAEELTGLANPSWATVVPFLQFNGVDQSPAADTAFGVDLEAEITVFSEDWDVLSFNA